MITKLHSVCDLYLVIERIYRKTDIVHQIHRVNNLV